jgi:hypothetical protein
MNLASLSKLNNTILTAYYNRDDGDWDQQIEWARARHKVEGRKDIRVIAMPWPPANRKGVIEIAG